MAKIVTRFAPSPTGYLHVGGARTALLNWLLARHNGTDGRYLLRIEDTDLERSTEQAADQLLEDLRWLGLHWDNAELVYQSKRLPLYNGLIDQLMARGLAYKAYEDKDELAALRLAAEREKKQFIYRRRDVPVEQLARYEAEGMPYVVRFAMPVKEYRFRDEVLDKEIVMSPDEVQDFVIRKTDGMPTYHFAVVVDDHEMGISHILRGGEHLKNTFSHIALQDALGFQRPTYAHLTTIQNPDASKMGKRDRDKAIRQKANEWIKAKKGTTDALAGASGLDAAKLSTWLSDSKKQLDLPEQAAIMHVIGLKSAELPEILVHDFRKNGYLPEALLNFLALLGWSPGGDREIMTIDEMVQLFSISGIGKSNPKFDRVKLLSFNTDTAAVATPERLLAAFKDYLSVNADSPLNGATDAELAKFLQIKKGFRLLREVDEAFRFLFAPDDSIEFDAGAVEKILRKNESEGTIVLREIREVLAAVTNWTAAGLEGAVKGYCEQKGLGLGKVAQPLRVAMTGTSVSPAIFESVELLGRDRTLRRIDRCLQL